MTQEEFRQILEEYNSYSEFDRCPELWNKLYLELMIQKAIDNQDEDSYEYFMWKYEELDYE